MESRVMTWLISVSKNYQHLHGIELMYVDGSGIHIHSCAVRIPLPRHLVEAGGGEVNMPSVEKTHHAHWMMGRTHDGRRWSLASRRRACHRLLDVGLVVLHRVLLCWRRWWRRRWAHIWFRFYSALDTGTTDRVAAFLKLQPESSVVDAVESCSWKEKFE